MKKLQSKQEQIREKEKENFLKRKVNLILFIVLLLPSLLMLKSVLSAKTIEIRGFHCEATWTCEGCGYSNWSDTPPYSCGNCGKNI